MDMEMFQGIQITLFTLQDEVWISRKKPHQLKDMDYLNTLMKI